MDVYLLTYLRGAFEDFLLIREVDTGLYLKMFALFGWIKHLQKKLKTPRLFDSEHSSLFPVRPIFPCTLQHADRTGQFTKLTLLYLHL